MGTLKLHPYSIALNSLVSLVFATGLILFAKSKRTTVGQECKTKLDEIDPLFGQLYKSNIIGLFFAELDGCILEANEAFLKMVGYTNEDLKQKKLNWRKMTPPQYRAADEDKIQNITATGLVAPYEKQYICKDGSRIDILIGAGKLEGLEPFVAVAYVLDITELKQAGEQLKQANLELDMRVKARTSELVEANQFLDSVLENIPHAIFVKDAKTLQVVRTNKAGEWFVGHPREEILGKTVYEFYAKEEADRITEEDHTIVGNRKFVDTPEIHISTNARADRILHTKKMPLYTSDGELRYILTIAEDITERKRLEAERLALVREQANREEETRSAQRIRALWESTALLSSSLDFQTTLNHLVHAVVPALADYSWVVIKLGDGTVKHLGSAAYDPLKADVIDEITKKYPIDVDSKDPAGAVLRTGLPKMISELRPEALEAFAHDAEHLDLLRKLNMKSYICVPLKARGETLGVLGLSLAAESNREYSDSDFQLLQTLAERASIATENARLYEEAQRANRVKDEFLAILSHELRTPLNVILGNTDLLRAGGLLPEETKRALEAIDRNAKLQTQIVTELIDVSSMITGKLSFKPQPVRPAEILRNAIENTEAAAKKKGILVSTYLDYDGVIDADPMRLLQIMWNLLTNAVKFTPTGGRITASLKRVGDECVLRVMDSGKGIDPKFLPHVFEPFRQEDSSSNRGYGGLGLGLSIAKGLTELHSGTIAVESNGIGQGATFTVKLPLHLAHVQPEVQTKAPPASGEDAVDLNGVEVLVVEDSDDSRYLIKRFLERAGAKVYAASSASEALDHLEHEHYDAIVSDISMPEMDGFEFMKTWRNKEKTVHAFTPAAALTAYAREEEKNKAYEAGFQSHIAKPTQASNLVHCVHDLVVSNRH